MPFRYYTGVRVPPRQRPSAKRRYGVTSHVLFYRRCSRQYGYMAERRYEPALAVQMFYGTVIHQVLDRAHAHYKGLVDPGRADQMPTDEDIEGYFAEVENGLRARRIYAVAGIRDHALTVLKRFNALEGPTLYPRVVDTECRLQADQGTHILHGNVDVLARVAASALQAGVHQDAAQLEIWDYKGTRKPTITSPDFQNYIFQMQVYAELYRRKTGHLPLRGVLYFLNELGGDPPPTARPINATMSVQFDRRGVTQAIDSFRATVADIERCRVIRQWPDPSEAPTEETCDACDVRWNCSAARRFERRYRMIYP